MNKVFDIWRDIEKTMSTTIQVNYEQVLYITCAELVSKYKAHRGTENGAAFERVLRFYLAPDEFEQLLNEID